VFRFYRSTTSRTAGLHGAALLIPRAVTGWLFVLHGLYKFGLHTGVLGPNGVGEPRSISRTSWSACWSSPPDRVRWLCLEPSAR